MGPATMKLQRPATYQAHRHRLTGGQALVEFMVVMGILLASLAIISLFIRVHRENGIRILNRVASEYP